MPDNQKSAVLPIAGIVAIIGGLYWAAKNAKAKETPADLEPSFDVEPVPPDVEIEPEPISTPEPTAPEPEPDYLKLPPIETLESSTPTMGKFYQVKAGDRFGGTGSRSIVFQALRDRARAAAERHGDPNPEAFANSVANSGIRRTRYLDLILCGGWNDLLYGTYGYGSRAHVGPHGRSIRLHKVHVDNRRQIAAGQAPIRNIQMLSPALRSEGKTAGAIEPDMAEAFEYLWLPPIDDDALYAGLEIRTEGLVWPDGTSVMWPPPSVVALDMDVYQDPGLAIYGCGTGEMAV